MTHRQEPATGTEYKDREGAENALSGPLGAPCSENGAQGVEAPERAAGGRTGDPDHVAPAHVALARIEAEHAKAERDTAASRSDEATIAHSGIAAGLHIAAEILRRALDECHPSPGESAPPDPSAGGAR
ncbi:hypothetical protein [Streptomyces natalensis]|uniref:Uncharacterized protein n=1 Tax=Streptomyces natalensis ATCC 27448 TaxID=1240678 RepID=A0A0D7CM01_9ACTN|nr:hypothetical protein [Streptomyces natalensis]KIZ16885.1 hypothetical protein SNA_18060 [Streptomyces natalensis ATCC 27448]